ncbi:MAG: ISAs1 family transposase, partial [Chloroflexota bacterium]|nr:ISAs1 family transposase [Chloroflexota bacterium]
MYATILPFSFAQPTSALVFDVAELYQQLQVLADQRDRRGLRYPLALMLTIAVLAKVAGQNRVQDIAEWASWRTKELCDLFAFERATLPHPTSWSRILGNAVQPDAVDQAVSTFLLHAETPLVPARASSVVALDGKTLRGTIPRGSTRGVHLLAAYRPEDGVVLAHVAVDQKENEIVAAPQLLRQLDLQGVVVTGDALLAQRTLSLQIVEAGGDYLWRIKDNQPTMRAEIALLFAPELVQAGWSAPVVDFTTARTVDAQHGRIEERIITVSSLLAEYSDWPYLAQVFKLERRVTVAEKRTTTEVHYGITSIPATVADAKRLLEVVRAHWGIENGLHQRRDVTMEEDAMQVRRGQAPHGLASLNNLSLGISLQ